MWKKIEQQSDVEEVLFPDGSMLNACGKSYYEFKLSLPTLHNRVGLVLPNPFPPSFWCTDVTPTSIRLHYRSERPGLTPVVMGIFRGLEQQLQTQTAIRHAAEAGQDKGVFHFPAA